MPVYDVNDIVEVKKREKRRKRRMKFFVFILIIAIIGGLYYYRQHWYPKLKGLSEKYQIISNDGQLAEGNFPIEMMDVISYQLEYTDDTIFVLDDTYVYVYNTNGGLIEKRQHAFNNAMLQANGGTALIYESGGTRIKVENDKKVVFTETMDDNIIFGTISQDGYTAVVTTSDRFASILYVYDDEGVLIYSRSCVERIIDVGFISGSKGCLLSFLGAKDGALITVTEKISFDVQEPIWSSEPIETLCLETASSSDDSAIILGDEECVYYDDSGEVGYIYSYTGNFSGGDVKGDKVAIICNDEQRRKYTLSLLSGIGKEPILIDSNEPLKSVLIYGDCAYIMNSENIMAYDFDGNLRSTVEITNAYTSFKRSEKYIFLIAHDRVDRIDYEN